MFNHTLAFVHLRHRADEPARGFKDIGFLVENIEIMVRFRNAVLNLTVGCRLAVADWTS